MNMKIKIKNKTIGDRSPVFIVAEAGINHNGNIKTLVDNFYFDCII